MLLSSSVSPRPGGSAALPSELSPGWEPPPEGLVLMDRSPRRAQRTGSLQRLAHAAMDHVFWSTLVFTRRPGSWVWGGWDYFLSDIACALFTFDPPTHTPSLGTGPWTASRLPPLASASRDRRVTACAHSAPTVPRAPRPGACTSPRRGGVHGEKTTARNGTAGGQKIPLTPKTHFKGKNKKLGQSARLMSGR